MQRVTYIQSNYLVHEFIFYRDTNIKKHGNLINFKKCALWGALRMGSNFEEGKKYQKRLRP